jgi:imidazolonepropionase-like amidohydrolase
MNVKQKIQHMTEVLGNLDATYMSDAEAVARYILAGTRGRYAVLDPADVDFIATVLQAYAKLLQDAGVKVV